jgi:hypothetical protein
MDTQDASVESGGSKEAQRREYDASLDIIAIAHASPISVAWQWLSHNVVSFYR